MYAFYRFPVDAIGTKELEGNLLKWESDLQNNDSFCMFIPENENFVYYSCMNKDIDDIGLLQELSEVGYSPEEIAKSVFFDKTNCRGKVFGSKRCLAVTRR
jgi:hypothetical protein